MEYIVVKPFVSKGKSFKVGDKIHPLECKNIRLKIGQRKLVALDLDNPHSASRLLNQFRKANLNIEEYVDMESKSKPKVKAKPKTKEKVEEPKPKAKSKPKAKAKKEVVKIELEL